SSPRGRTHACRRDTSAPASLAYWPTEAASSRRQLASRFRLPSSSAAGVQNESATLGKVDVVVDLRDLRWPDRHPAVLDLVVGPLTKPLEASDADALDAGHTLRPLDQATKLDTCAKGQIVGMKHRTRAVGE